MRCIDISEEQGFARNLGWILSGRLGLSGAAGALRSGKATTDQLSSGRASTEASFGIGANRASKIRWEHWHWATLVRHCVLASHFRLPKKFKTVFNPCPALDAHISLCGDFRTLRICTVQLLRWIERSLARRSDASQACLNQTRPQSDVWSFLCEGKMPRRRCIGRWRIGSSGPSIRDLRNFYRNLLVLTRLRHGHGRPQ